VTGGSPDPGQVVLICPGVTEIGGAGKRSRWIACSLAQRGWDVRAVTRAGTLRWPRLHRAERLTIVEVPGFGKRRLGALLFYATAAPLALWWSRKGAVILSVQLMSTAVVAALCGLLRRRPFIVMSTTSGTLGESRYLRGTRTFPVRRRLLRAADVVVAQTAGVADELGEMLGRDDVTVIPNPAPLVEPSPLPGRPVAAFAGRLSAEKGLFDLLAAWERVLPGLDDGRLLVIGSGGIYRSVEAELRAAVANAPLLDGSVEFTGWVDDPGVHLRQAQLFVFPSREEGMSNALLEAGAHRRIVVASDIAPNRAVLGDDYPFLFAPGDVDALARTMVLAFEDQGLRASAIRKIDERFKAFAPSAVLEQIDGLLQDARARSDRGA
jgi:glycosyltransferase involved in cell wall biosynthesis